MDFVVLLSAFGLMFRQEKALYKCIIIINSFVMSLTTTIDTK